MLYSPMNLTIPGIALMSRPPAPPVDEPAHITLETDDTLLLEDGGLILLETE